MVRDSTEHLLSSFTATRSGNHIILEWSTKSEYETLGFNLFRSESREGEYTRINPDFIMAASTNAGSKYQFIDKNIKNGETYLYKLEQIDIKGTGTMYGPVSVTLQF